MKNIFVSVTLVLLFNIAMADPFLIHSGGYANHPSIGGDKVVWNHYKTVYLYDLTTGVETTLTTDGVFPDTDGEMIVWYRLLDNYEVEIRGRNIGTGQEFHIANAKRSSGSGCEPTINGNLCAWMDYPDSSGPPHIVIKNIFTGLSEIISSPAWNPDIERNYIVWTGVQTIYGKNLTQLD